MNPKTCPVCGGALRRGRLSSSREIFWISDENHQRSFWEDLLHDEALQIPDRSTPEGWSDPYGDIPVRHCPNCNLFLFAGRLEEDSLIPERFRGRKEKR